MAVPSWAQSQLAQLRGGIGITTRFWQRHGLREGLRRLVQTKEVMDGDLKGADQFGNQYYENLQRQPGRQRFVIYRGWGAQNDPSQIPAEWHHWLHHISDRTPVERPPQPHRWQLSKAAQQLSGHGMEGRYAPAGSYLRTEPKQHTSYNVWEKESVKDQDNSGTQPRV